MTSTPGRPAEPTLHQARTRPEATDIALKNRSTNDWFRHDASTMKVVPIGGTIHQKPQSTGDWLSTGDKVAAAPRRCLSRQTEAVHDKVQGRQEDWFKHDDNRHYVDPIRADRGSTEAKQLKGKMCDASKQTADWYKHEHQLDDVRVVTKAASETSKSRLVGPVAQEIGLKLQTKAGLPDWYEHKAADQQSGVDAIQLKSRLRMKEAVDNLERDRAGCTSDWYYSPDSSELPDEQPYQPGFRVASQQGQDIAAKLSSESEHWFEHGNVNLPPTKQQSDVVRNISAKHRGTVMRQILEGAVDKNAEIHLDMNPARQRMTPDAQQFAIRSQQGMIGKVLDQENNHDYQSPGRCPRAVKPEAMATFSKNKGCMDECLQGYLPPPNRYDVHKSHPSDPSVLVKHSGLAMEKTLKGELPNSGRAHFARTVKPEASGYAERNRGTVGQVLTDFGRPTSVDVSGGKGLRTEAAQEIARKYQQGSVQVQRRLHTTIDHEMRALLTVSPYSGFELSLDYYDVSFALFALNYCLVEFDLVTSRTRHFVDSIRLIPFTTTPPAIQWLQSSIEQHRVELAFAERAFSHAAPVYSLEQSAPIHHI